MQFRQRQMAENTHLPMFQNVLSRFQPAITFDSHFTETASRREIYVNTFSYFLAVSLGILCHYLFWGFSHYDLCHDRLTWMLH